MFVSVQCFLARKLQVNINRETKVKYSLKFGIAPYFRTRLPSNLRRNPFCFKFDETTIA